MKPTSRALPQQLSLTVLGILAGATLLAGCDSGVVVADLSSAQESRDVELRQRVASAGVSGDVLAGRTLPDINDPLAQLGKSLFFSTALGGNFEVACVTCHHPELGGGDALSLSVGVSAIESSMLGPGRIHAIDGHPNVPRNAPTVFNMGLWDRSIFWDARIENLDTLARNNGSGANIRTPDSGFNDADLRAGENLTAAQARFPVTSAAEMRTDEFAAGASNDQLRNRLAARLGNYGAGSGELAENTWTEAFATAFNDPSAPAERLVSYDNIAFALAEYERSMVFTDNPFNRWVNGDNSALSESQKRGVALFYTNVEDGGAGCANCHTGDFFTDEKVHVVAAVQIGEGKGDGRGDDFGRERETAAIQDRYKFRTPTLLNVEVTGPYGHAGAYDTLLQVVDHYSDPVAAVQRWFDQGGVCAVEQFAAMVDCSVLYPDTRANTEAALATLQRQRALGESLFANNRLTQAAQIDLVEFLKALTDPCVKNVECLAPWVADPRSRGQDGMRLNGIDKDGRALGVTSQP